MEFNDFFAGEDDHNRRLDKIIRKLAKHNLNIAMSGTNTFTIQDPNIVNNNNGRTCFC